MTRFNQLFIEFTRTEEHGPELTLLLDEMLNRGLVIPEEYCNLNSLVPKEEADEEEEQDGMTRVIKNTVDHVIQHCSICLWSFEMMSMESCWMR